jgi:acyl-coenzyme A synthetase/AMP-(fatty) acid ligase
MVGAGTTSKYLFDLRPGDIYWCTADCGWITGHTYLTYGPMLNGVTQVRGRTSVSQCVRRGRLLGCCVMRSCSVVPAALTTNTATST